MKIIASLLAIAIASCALPPTNSDNPLDRPYDRATARELHEGNMQNITDNPAYYLP